MQNWTKAARWGSAYSSSWYIFIFSSPRSIQLRRCIIHGVLLAPRRLPRGLMLTRCMGNVTVHVASSAQLCRQARPFPPVRHHDLREVVREALILASPLTVVCHSLLRFALAGEHRPSCSFRGIRATSNRLKISRQKAPCLSTGHPFSYSEMMILERLMYRTPTVTQRRGTDAAQARRNLDSL